MPSGILGRANLSAATNTTIYTVPATKVASLNLNVCNRGANPVLVRVALAAADTPANDEWLEYDTVINTNSVLERTGIVLQAGSKLVLYSNTANVTAIAYGFEE